MCLPLVGSRPHGWLDQEKNGLTGAGLLMEVADDPLRALRRAPRHRLFTHFPDGGKCRRRSSNQFSSIVTCRSTLASFGCSCGSHAMMRVPSGVRSNTGRAYTEGYILRGRPNLFVGLLLRHLRLAAGDSGGL